MTNEADKPSVEGLSPQAPGYAIHSCSYFCERPGCIRAQRNELRERLASEAAPAAQPVAWADPSRIESLGPDGDDYMHVKRVRSDKFSAPLFAGPPAAQPATPLREVLSDEQIDAIADRAAVERSYEIGGDPKAAQAPGTRLFQRKFARALLAASSDEAPKDPYGY